MTAGMTALVPVAEQLALVAGSRVEALALANAVLARGVAAMPAARDDAMQAAHSMLQSLGCLTADGAPVQARVAELVIVCSVLAAATPETPPPPHEMQLVLAAPVGTAAIAARESLSNLVMSTIRGARRTLHFAGAFWNPVGFDQLNQWLLPAMQTRSVEVTYYMNLPDEARLGQMLDEQIRVSIQAGRTEVRWFAGVAPRMQHVKFAIADESTGYLGTANLTSWGLADGHVEAGVELTAHQASRLVAFFSDLENAGVFHRVRPSS